MKEFMILPHSAQLLVALFAAFSCTCRHVHSCFKLSGHALHSKTSPGQPLQQTCIRSSIPQAAGSKGCTTAWFDYTQLPDALGISET